MLKMQEKQCLTPFVVAVLALSSVAVMAQEEKPTGFEIMKKTREAYTTEDQKATVTLRLFSKDGSERKIETTRLFKNYFGKGGFDMKFLFITEFPPDSRGVGFMIWDYAVPGKADDLWLYLPSLRQTRRLSTRDQHDAFMGSDLTFGDMGQRGLEEDEYALLREEIYRGRETFVVESVPKGKDSLYSKKVSWIDREDLIILKIEYYDTKRELLKTQTMEWQKVSDLYAWKSSEVRNVQTGHKTIVEISNLQVNTGITDETFTERNLQRGVVPGTDGRRPFR